MMKIRSMMLLAAGGVGYVLGAKAGRTRYEQLRQKARLVAEDPRVQQAAHKAQETIEQKAPGLADKVRPQGEHTAATYPGTGTAPGSAGTAPGGTGWPEDDGLQDSASTGAPSDTYPKMGS